MGVDPSITGRRQLEHLTSLVTACSAASAVQISLRVKNRGVERSTLPRKKLSSANRSVSVRGRQLVGFAALSIWAGCAVEVALRVHDDAANWEATPIGDIKRV